jgi:ribose transport system substrate-binding protein
VDSERDVAKQKISQRTVREGHTSNLISREDVNMTTLKRMIAILIVTTVFMLAFGSATLKAQETVETVYDYAFEHHDKEWVKSDKHTVESFEKRQWRIGLSIEGLSHPCLVRQKEDAEKIASRYPNVKLEVISCEDNIAKQVSDIEDFIAKGVDALLICSANPQALVGVLEEADRNGVPYFFFLKGLTGVNAVSQAIAGYSLEGKTMGDYVYDQLKDKGGNVVIIEGIPGDESSISRCGQFRKVLEASPKIKILASQPGWYRREPAMKVMEDFLAAFPKIDYVFGANDENALAALEATRAAGKLDEITIVGIDGQQEALDAIKAGEMKATATHSFDNSMGVTLGGTSMQFAIDYLMGKDVPRWHVSTTDLVTEENVDKMEPLF